MRERFTAGDEGGAEGRRQARLSTVRLIQAALKDKDIEARGAGQGAGERGGDPGAPAEDDQAAPGIGWRSTSRPAAAELAEQEREETDVIAALPAEADGRGRDGRRHRSRHRRDRRRDEGHGQGHRRLAGQYAGQMDFGKASGLVKEVLPKG